MLKLKFIFIPCEENNYRPKFLDGSFLFYYLIFLLVLKILAISLLVYFPENIFFAEITKTNLINFTNNERNELGIQPLKENSQLEMAAFLKAEDMMEKDYFSHKSPEGITPWHWFKKANYNYQLAGENLAIGFLDSEEVYQAWLNSPSHRANLLNPNYNEIGIAILKGEFEGKKTTVVVQHFGVPLSVAAAQEPKQEIESLTEGIISEPKKETIEEPLSEGVVAGEEKEKEAAERDLTFKFSSFIFSEYFGLTQKIIYASLIFVIIALIINIFVRIQIQRKDLIYKAVFFLALLVLFAVLDKGTMIQIIPHPFNIY